MVSMAFPPGLFSHEGAAETTHAAAKPRQPVRRAHGRAGARPAVRQPRRPVPYRCAHAHGAALGLAAMDLLRARLQGPPARRLGPLLYRAVLSRRADRARG